MNQTRPFSWWWPSHPVAHWIVLSWLIVAAAVGLVGGPVGSFINAAVWYGMFMAVRFVYIHATGGPAIQTPTSVSTAASTPAQAARVPTTSRGETKSVEAAFLVGAGVLIVSLLVFVLLR